MVEDAGDAQAPVDAGVEVIRQAGDVVGLHEGNELVTANVYECVADVASLSDFDGVAAHHLEAKDVLVEIHRCVEVVGGEADVRESLVGHLVTSSAVRSFVAGDFTPTLTLPLMGRGFCQVYHFAGICCWYQSRVCFITWEKAGSS